MDQISLSDINECASNACQNGATCTNLQNRYTCTCTGGWTGTYQATARNGARGKWHLLTPKYLEKIKSLFIKKNGNRKGLGIRLL